MKKSVRGFTLIELLVVIAIIGLLSTVIAAPIQNARKKAKDVKKMAELKAVQSALEQYAEANGQYPTILNMLVPQYMARLPVYAASSTAVVRDRFAYVVFSGTPAGGTATRFGYHLGVHLDVYAEALANDADCTDVTANSTTITPPACVWFNGPVTTSFSDWTSGMVGTGVAADFVGSEGGDTSCSTVANCVFDITGQY